MHPTRRLDDRPRLASSLVQLVVAAIGIGLEDAGVACKMLGGMLAAAIARVIEHRRRRALAAEGPVVPNVNPTSPGVGLAGG
jgi:hypothetical protein